MKKTRLILAALVTMTVVLTAQGAAAAEGGALEGLQQSWDTFRTENEFYNQFVADRVEVGLRISRFTFDHSRKVTHNPDGSIAGGYTSGVSTSDMDEEQNYFPYLYFLYKFTPYVALQAAWETIEGRTLTLDKADPHSDGNVVGEGLSLTAIGRYPNETPFTPYAGIGLAWMRMGFDEDPSWYAHGLRHMDIDDTTALLLSLGCSVEVHKNVELDVAYTYFQAEADNQFYLRVGGVKQGAHDWTYPLDSHFWHIGVKYLF
ncbi:MAG: outer membrane beta-barrel protein [Verrucomicrobia bacterium]|nr:outer membrane beta-barrel protein [Verrucomicrobiota bacterium]